MLRAAGQAVDTARRSGDLHALATAFAARAHATLAAQASDRYDDAIHDLRQALVRHRSPRPARPGPVPPAPGGRWPAGEALAEFGQAAELLRRAADLVGRAVATTDAGHLLIDVYQAGEALP
ncbi:hypothetical protein [Saccharothrix xinjiangensis]|uniref:Tetratricopeptide repeat protein n=1 Tax=Saccharothrix xinjiangensis TaxID=204798 RepID=A0ABV9XWB1_9PSEU